MHVITQLLRREVVDQIILFPAGQPRLREHSPIATGPQRRHMCELAVHDLPADISSRVEVNPIEILREGPSYTIDTLRSFGDQFPGAQFFLLIGEDQGKALGTWREIEEIARRAIICVAERETPEPTGPDAPTHDIPTQTLKLPPLPHSATEVRARVAHGQSIDALVPKTVALYIQRHHLYQPAR